MPTHILIYPVTLFSGQEYKKLFDETEEKPKLWYVEDPAYFTRYKFHKKKLVLHRASMKRHMSEQKLPTEYVEYKKVPSFYSNLKNSDVFLFDPNDSKLLKQLTRHSKSKTFSLQIYPSPGFFLTTEEALQYGKGKKKYYNAMFYKFMRKKTGYLMTKKGTPEGGKWSYDTDNRKKLPSNLKIPPIPHESLDKFTKEAISYTNKNFKANYGSTENYFYPTSRREALRWLRDFINKRIKLFGPYQDFIAEEHKFLFHSILSSSINTGLLTSREVCEAVLDAYTKKKTTLQSCEGFIRQVISWREYVRMIYLSHGHTEPNFFQMKQGLNKKFYTGNTGILIVDKEIKKAVQYAYSHHIVRLMVFGNIFTLLHLHPTHMFRWFSELFIDAYDWVMWANVYGMGSYADGGLTMMRPYISSSNYLKNMSDYPRGEWEQEVTDLYYTFLGKYSDKLKKIYATSSQVARWKKFPQSKKNEINRGQRKVMNRVFR